MQTNNLRFVGCELFFGGSGGLNGGMADSYFKVILSGVSSSLEDEVSGLCFEFDCLGVAEALPFRQTGRTYEPETLESDIKKLEVFFEFSPPDSFFDRVRELDASIQIDIINEESRDWLEEWKKGFDEFELVSGVWVVPSWKAVPEAAKDFLLIDPGMAFGTGTHETTKIASQALVQVFSNPTRRNVLDVGTGTGILAMLAEKLGAHKVHGIEIEPEARRVAKENVANNKMNKTVILDDSIENLSGCYDVVIANIIDGVLVQIQEHLKRCLQLPFGALILTGILREREESFKAEFQLPPGTVWKKRFELGEWVGFLVEAP